MTKKEAIGALVGVLLAGVIVGMCGAEVWRGEGWGAFALFAVLLGFAGIGVAHEFE